jgi:hypothetical protein
VVAATGDSIAPRDQAFLIGVSGLIALAVTLGLSAVWRTDAATDGT